MRKNLLELYSPQNHSKFDKFTNMVTNWIGKKITQ